METKSLQHVAIETILQLVVYFTSGLQVLFHRERYRAPDKGTSRHQEHQSQDHGTTFSGVAIVRQRNPRKQKITSVQRYNCLQGSSCLDDELQSMKMLIKKHRKKSNASCDLALDM